MRFFWHSMRKYKIWAVFAMLAITLAVSVETYTLLAFQSFIDAIASRLDQSIVWSRATLYVGAHLFISVFWRASGFSGMRWFLNTRDASYRYLFQHTIHQDKNYFANNFAGSLLTKVNNIVNGTQDFFQSILWTYYPITIQILIYFVVEKNISREL